MMIKQHKSGCMANIHCAVYHPDGICSGPYGKCTCDEIEVSKTNMPKPNKEEIQKAEDLVIRIGVLKERSRILDALEKADLPLDVWTLIRNIIVPIHE